jgi:class 3 adenylate cyclase
MEPELVTARTMEDEAQAASRHLQWMKKAFARVEYYQEVFGEIERFAARHKLGTAALKLLERHKNLGIIYVEIDDRFRNLNEEAVSLLTKVLSEDLTAKSETEIAAKWRSFFDRYWDAMFKCYKATLAADPALNLAFETAGRMVIENALKKWLDGLKTHEQQFRDEIIQKLAKELNGFFHHIRSKLASETRFDDSLIAETYSRSMFMPGTLLDIQMNDLSVALRENGLPAELYENIHKFFASSLREEFEERLVDQAELKPPTSRREIPKLVEGRPFYISDNGLVKLQRIFVKKAEKFVGDSIPELSEIDTKLKQAEKKLRGEIIQSLESVNESLSKLSSTQENFAKLSSDVKKKLETLEEALNRNFWSIGELKRRQSVLRERIENAHDLRTINPKDLREIISRDVDPSKISMDRVPEEFTMIKEKHGEGLGLLSKKERDTLGEIIREQAKYYTDDLKTAKKKGESTRQLEKEATIMEEFSSGGRLGGKKYDVDEVLRRYLRISQDVVEPFCVSKKIIELFKLWPPESSAPSIEGTSLLDEAKYIGEELDYRTRFYRIRAEEQMQKAAPEKPLLEMEENLDLREAIVENFAEVISVLVYDIRGSTFMGKRLKNAKVENEIRCAFNAEMLKVAKRNGAFALKDTGDGGILFFGGNSKEMYDLSYTTVRRDGGSSRQYTFAEELGELQPSPKASERAIKCAQEMVSAARKFVEENLSKYPNWFRETSERSIFHEGIAYANLPPEYQRIFQIGVGIASGTAGRDVFFGLNSYGDPDITGVLIRDANFYSKARDPRRSVVLCDGATALNLLLNAERFEPTDMKEAQPGLVHPDRGERLLREEVVKAARLKEERKGFKFSQFGIAIERIGYQLLSGEKLVGKLDLALKEEDLIINKFAELMDEKGGEIKVIYEILPEKE